MDQPTEISALPPEMLTQILQYLGLADLVKLKSVCKLFNELISSNVKVTGLVVDTIADIRRGWYNTAYKPFDHRQMQVCHVDLFFRNRGKPILSQLKFLRLNSGVAWIVTELSPINSFSELLRLDLNFEQSAYLEVNLEKLEILKIWINRAGFLRVDCPRLRVLVYEEEPAGCLEIIRPKSLVELNTITFNYNLGAFENLEILRCGNQYMLDERTLTNLPKLKMLYFNASFGGQGMMEHLERFIAIKNELKRTDLLVYLSGVRLTDYLDEINFNKRQENDGIIENYLDDFEYFYIRNYERLQDGPLESVCEANYSRLMSATDQMPADYFDRFPNIEAITVDGRVDNQEHFLWYLQNLKGEICELKLENSGLGQRFYDSLPTFCSPYHFIDNSEEQELNYRFLAEFEFLTYTVIRQELTLESARSLIDSHANLKHFADLYFRFNGQRLRLYSNKIGVTRRAFTLLINSETAHESDRLDEIIEWIESNVFV